MNNDNKRTVNWVDLTIAFIINLIAGLVVWGITLSNELSNIYTWFIIIVFAWFTTLYFFLRARKLSNWRGVEKTTGLQGYVKKLKGSKHHPEALLNSIRLRLDFMGHGASKWTANENELSKMLSRIEFNDGAARFLIINPLHTGLNKPRAVKVAKSLRTLSELQRKHKNLHVRVYQHIPQIRLTFYDHALLAVGHYQGLERKDSDETPLLVFVSDCDWSFYKAFLSHFEEEWNRAIVLKEEDMAKIEILARGEDLPNT